MCAIFGFAGFSDADLLRRMANTLPNTGMRWKNTLARLEPISATPRLKNT